MAIEVISLNNVLVDGQPAGKVTDVLANYKVRASELFTALKVWKGVEDKAVADARTAENDRITAAHAEEIAVLNERINAVTVDNKALAAQVDALGGTDLAAAIAADKRKAELQSTIDAAMAELARIDEVVSSPAVESATTDATVENVSLK